MVCSYLVFWPWSRRRRHFCPIWSAGGYHAALAGGYVLCRLEEVEGAGIEGAGQAGLEGSADGLVGVLEDVDGVLGGNPHDFVHGGRNAEEVDGKDGPRFGLRLSGCRWVSY